MKKKREPKAPARTTIAGIKKEMQRPRLAGSVRDDSSYQVVLATERPTRLAVKEAERLPMFSVEVV